MTKKSYLDRYSQAAEQASGKGGFKQDPRYWQPTADKAGNGYAIIRFLPPLNPDAEDGSELPWIMYYNHSFKGPTGAWYIERCRTSLGEGEKDPVVEDNSRLYATGREEDKKTAQPRSRRKVYVSNIYVVKDPGNPENEGKVYLYQYGQKIFDMLKAAMAPPQFPDDVRIDPFSIDETGANFQLRIIKKDGRRSYERSKFEDQRALTEDAAEAKKILAQRHDLLAENAPDKYKSYEKLEAKFRRVIGAAQSPLAEDGAYAGEAPMDAPKASKTKSYQDAMDKLHADDDISIDELING